jgi:hypothetical protein
VADRQLAADVIDVVEPPADMGRRERRMNARLDALQDRKDGAPCILQDFSTPSPSLSRRRWQVTPCD